MQLRGGNPTAKSAGVEINPPPPTTESINEAINPKHNSNDYR